MESRFHYLDTDIGWFPDLKDWKNLKAFGKCESLATWEPPADQNARLFRPELLMLE